MTSKSWRRLETLYHDARDLPPDKRATFLARECADDVSLRRNVESLLAHTSDFLEQPAFHLSLHSLPSVAAPTFTVGQQVGSYVIRGALGHGGMGEVFRGHDTRLRRDVAIKVLPAAFAHDPERRVRLEREARVLASLHHPHIATIFGIEEFGATLAIVMELVEGPTLDDHIGGQPRPIPETLRLARQIVDALDAAHEKGIVHRDLKPANIKLTADGYVKVLDFGLATISSPVGPHGDTLTVAAPPAQDAIAGTPGYMSPEQARGQAVDRRVDVWAFGCVLFEMLTGTPAFNGTSVLDVLAKVLQADPNWDALPAATPPLVRRLVTRCVTKDPSARLRDIGDARADLVDVLSPSVVPTPRRAPSFLVVGIVLIVAVAAALLAAFRPPRGDTGTVADLEAVTSDPGYSTDPVLSADGRLLAFASDRAGDGNLDVWVQQIGGDKSLRLTDDPADDRAPDFSPDGSQIVFRSERDGGGIYLVAALGGPSRLLVARGRNPKFSPDGMRVAYWTGQFRGSLANNPSELHVLSLANGESRRLLDNFAIARNPVWSPDGKSLLVVGRRGFSEADGGLDWWRVPVDGTPPEQTKLMSWDHLAVDLANAGGSYLGIGPWRSDGFVVARGGSLWRLPLSPSGQLAGEPQQLTLSVASSLTPASSRDGQIAFAAATLTRHIERIAVNTSNSLPQTLYSDYSPEEWRASTSADGQMLVFERLNGTRFEIWERRLDTGEQRAIATVGSHVVNATVSPDGKRITYNNGDSPDADSRGGYVVDVAGGVPRRICQRCSLWGFLPDNIHAIGTLDRNVIAVFTDNGTRHEVLRVDDGVVDRPSVSPDGHTIAFRIERGARGKTYVSSLSMDRAAPSDQWSEINESTTTGRPCGWSPDSSTMYLLLDTDGFRDLWGQRISHGRPIGRPFVVRHLHEMTGVSTSLGNAVTAQGFLYETGRYNGNIWRLALRSRSD